MRSFITIALLFLFSTCKAQDSTDVLKKQSFIDSLGKNEYFVIECLYSTCYYHKKYKIKISKILNNYYAQIRTVSTRKGDKPKTANLKTLSHLKRSQIDSTRKFEAYLNLYSTEGGGGPAYYSYFLTLGKKNKYYLDGVPTDPWMRIEGLVKILFPLLKQD